MTLHNPDRRHSDAKKWQKYAGRDIIPLWIADSDYAVDPQILSAAAQRLQHPVFGYPYDEPDFLGAFIDHCARRYGWQIEAEWIVAIPGCVPGLNFCRGVSRLRGKNAAILTTPVYPPFFHGARMMAEFAHHRVPARYRPDGWENDFPALETAAAEPDSGLLLLCHPHNPIGHVWRDDELREYARIAREHDLIVCSDEIHCDLILNHRPHRPFAMLDDDAAHRTITLMAPSKTWNIAGMCAAYAVIANSELRRQFRQSAAGFTDVNVLGRIMAAAAYRHGENWRQKQEKQLQANAKILERRVNALPGVHVTPVEATYLALIDCRALKLAQPQRYFEEHGLGFADGADYGAPGFIRFNFACSAELLDQALTRFENAVRARMEKINAGYF